ncbi:MAG: rRNA maturation RNase YbeY [Chloroflexi bacterium]|nr:MAG: rRNA maturation RNase YbeY [Chloroflexota bacterium]
MIVELFEVDVQCLVGVPEGVAGVLETAVFATLTHQQINPPAGLSLVLTDDDQLQQLNRDFRQIDAPTDVLSFPAQMPEIDIPDMVPYLGDILISVPYASRQATKEGHSLIEELQLLTVHGVLHLLGYDHMEPAEKEKMWGVQTAVLHKLQVTITLPDEA